MTEATSGVMGLTANASSASLTIMKPSPPSMPHQAVKRNAERFPQGYVFQLDDKELAKWKSQIVTSNLSKDDEASIKMGIRRAPYAFTEKGLYMLATVLKSDRAIRTTLAIIETYAQVRAMVRDMEALQSLKDGSVEQATKLTQAGHKLASLIGDNLSTDSASHRMSERQIEVESLRSTSGSFIFRFTVEMK